MRKMIYVYIYIYAAQLDKTNTRLIKTKERNYFNGFWATDF